MSRDVSNTRAKRVERRDESPAPSPSPSARDMDSLTILLTEQGLVEYEGALREKGITEPQHLLRLTPAVIESLIPDKPIHQRKLAALSRGRNLNAATFSTEVKNPARPPPKLGGGAAAFRSRSADDILPEKPGIRSGLSTEMPELSAELTDAINTKFGDEFSETVVKFLKLQGVVCSPDLKYADVLVLTEQVKDAGAKPIQIGKLKDWCPTQAQVMPAVEEVPAAPEPAPVVEEPTTKKKRPKPKARRERSSSNNDVIETAQPVEDPMEKALLSRFGAYRDPIQSFLMTQGVLMEDDLMIRDVLKMTTTAQNVGVKPVQLAKLKEWMQELKELDSGHVHHRPILPHEKRGSKLRVSKSAIAQTGKEYDNAIRASRASRDMDGYDSSSRRTSRSSRDTIGESSVASRRSSKSSHSKDSGAPVRRGSKVPKKAAAAEDLSL